MLIHPLKRFSAYYCVSADFNSSVVGAICGQSVNRHNLVGISLPFSASEVRTTLVRSQPMVQEEPFVIYNSSHRNT